MTLERSSGCHSGLLLRDVFSFLFVSMLSIGAGGMEKMAARTTVESDNFSIRRKALYLIDIGCRDQNCGNGPDAAFCDGRLFFLTAVTAFVGWQDMFWSCGLLLVLPELPGMPS